MGKYAFYLYGQLDNLWQAVKEEWEKKEQTSEEKLFLFLIKEDRSGYSL